MINQKLKNREIILCSGSPRRRELLAQLGISFSTMSPDVDESFPENLKREEIATYLSGLKAMAVKPKLGPNQIAITADTIVWARDKVYNKPLDKVEAIKMLQELSGRAHEVITSVSLTSQDKLHSFFSVTEVIFKDLSEEEIEYYVSEFSPFDKAGAYGIQEWIGLVGVESLKGSYTNVVGLPTAELYTELMRF